jgi:tetratricopeptide (TPR) repeat protein
VSVFDVLSLIPPSLRQQVLDALVGFVSKQAKKFLGDAVSDKIEGPKSDGSFRKKFREGLQRAADRFVREYEVEDEDLVAAITADESLFKNKQVQEALLAIVKEPGIYLADEREAVIESFETVLPGRKNRQRVDRAVTFFLKCLAKELWTLPELRGVYAFQFQRMTAEATRQQVELQKAQIQVTAGLGVEIRQALLQLTDAIAERKLLPGPDTLAFPVPPQVYHNLPQPDYGTFVGREQEQAQIHRLLSPESRHFLVTIDGIGGIGKSALALGYCEKARKIWEELDNPREVASCYTRSGPLYSIRGDYEKAESLILRGLRTHYDMNDDDRIGAASIRLAEVYFSKGELEQSEKYFREGLKDRKSFEAHQNFISSLLGLAKIAKEQGECNLAIEYAQQALEEAEKLGMGQKVHEAKKILQELNDTPD